MGSFISLGPRNFRECLIFAREPGRGGGGTKVVGKGTQELIWKFFDARFFSGDSAVFGGPPTPSSQAVRVRSKGRYALE